MNERTLELGEKFQRLGRVSGKPRSHAALRRSIADKRAQHREVTNVSGSKHGRNEILRATRSYSALAALRVLFLTNGRLRIMSGRRRSSRVPAAPHLTRRSLLNPLVNEVRRDRPLASTRKPL